MVIRSRTFATCLSIAMGLSGTIGIPTARSSDDGIDYARVAALNLEGTKAFKAQDYAEALRRFEQALALDPKAVEIRENIGRTHAVIGAQLFEQGSGGGGGKPLREAIQQLQQAHLYYAGDASTHHVLGRCHFELGEFAAAERAIRKALGFEPKSYALWRSLSLVLEKEGRTVDAIHALELALRERPKDARIATRIKRLRFDVEAASRYRKLVRSGLTIEYPPELSQPLAERVQKTLSETVTRFAKRWGVQPPKNIVAICYPPGEFAERTGFHEDVGGAYDGKIRIAFPADLQKGGLALDQVIRHETVHLLLHELPEKPERWLDEGLAQHFDAEARDEWFGHFRRLNHQDPRLGIEDRQRRFHPERTDSWAALYLHSYCLIHHLSEVGGDFRLDMVIREVQRGQPWSKAFEGVYGKPIAELDRQWRVGLESKPK